MSIPAEVAHALVDPKAYADGARLEDAFSWLRREAPFAKIQVEGFNPFWAVTKFSDIQAIERDSAFFLSGGRPAAITDAKSERQAEENPMPIRTLVQMDAPDHSAYRRLTQEWFMPQNLRKIEARVREVAREFVDQMAATEGECDFGKDIAFRYPLRVIMEILGVPREDEPMMLKLTQELFANGDPDIAREDAPADEQARFMETVMEMVTYFNAMTEDRRKNPRDDLATAIANGKINGEAIGELEAMGYYVIIASAGHDTTSGSIAGGMWALCDNPNEFNKLKSDSGLISNFVEESVRWVTPVKHFMRTAAQNTEFNGHKITKGDWLMLCYSSANRDEDQFEAPNTFSVERHNTKNIAFGFGPHVCLGQHLSRMEMRIFWEELLARLDHVELAGTPLRTEATFVCGPKTVPIRFSMR